MDFDEKTYDEAYLLLKYSSIYSGKDLFAVRKDPDCGQVIAASFVELDMNEVWFDIVVFEEEWGRGHAKSLVTEIIDYFWEMEELSFWADCVSPAMVHILETHFDFQCVKELGPERKIMSRS